MRTVLLLALLQPPTDAERVGIAWFDATEDAALRQRVTRDLADLAGVDPTTLEADVVDQARWADAHSVAPAAAEKYARLRDRLGEANDRYRAGEFEGASAGASAVTSDLRADPGLPGAARLTWRAEILLAQVAWSRQDVDAARAALRRAATLDPRAVLSTRKVPPDLVAEHERIIRFMEEARASWSTPRVELNGAADVEVDGRPLAGPVPPGDHFLVVRRPGREAVARFGPVSEAWVVPDGAVLVPPRVPDTRAAGDAVCDASGVSWFLLVRRRGDRVGLQRFVCGEGFAPPSFVPVAEVARGAREAVTSGDGRVASAAITRDPWPGPAAAPPPRAPVGPPEQQDRKPWFRRAWIWTIVGVVVAGAITTGVVLGTQQDGRRVQVDVPSFTEPD